MSLYTTLAPDQIVWIANHCGGTVAFVEDEAHLATMRRVKPEIPTLRTVVLMRGQPTGEDWVVGWDEVRAAGRAAAAADPAAFDRLWQQIQPNDLLSLIYTSGTTGTPKGVMYTHRNILWTAESIGRLAGRDMLADARLISYLPLAHAAETVDQPLVAAVAVRRPRRDRHGPVLPRPHPAAALPDRDPADHLRRRPAGVGEAAGRDPRRAWPPSRTSSAGQWCVHALDVAHQVAGLRHHGKRVPAELDAAHARFAPVYAAIRARLGFDQCRWAITSAAPTPLDVELFFAGIGLPLLEMWGMSELTGPATAVSPHDVRFGTCGAALPGVEARLAEDGELIVRGGNVMAGYYRAPEQTAQTIGPGGWLHTGDIAQVDADGYYRIVDRKKELIITSSGKNIAPVQVEAQLKRHPLVGQAIAVGDRRSHLTAVLVLDADVAPGWARARGIAAGQSGRSRRAPGGDRGGAGGGGRGERTPVPHRAGQTVRAGRRGVDAPVGSSSRRR